MWLITDFYASQSHGRAIMSSNELSLALSQVTCFGSNPSIQSRGSSEYPTLHPNMAPATVPLQVAWPPCITSSVMAVLLTEKKTFLVILPQITHGTPRFEYLEKVSLNFSSLWFEICVNLLHSYI